MLLGMNWTTSLVFKRLNESDLFVFFKKLQYPAYNADR